MVHHNSSGDLGLLAFLSVHHEAERRVEMTDTQPRLERWTFRFLLIAVAAAALGLLLAAPWDVPPVTETAFWNALIAFAVLGIASDSSFLPNPRISTARVGSSVVFVPFLASAMLFLPPWPMVIALVTGLVSQIIVRRKGLVRAAFNTAQYMLAVGLAALVYTTLGGHVGFDSVHLNLRAFAALVIVFFVVNHGTVSVAVSLTTDISLREAWRGITGELWFYDLISSSLAI